MITDRLIVSEILRNFPSRSKESVLNLLKLQHSESIIKGKIPSLKNPHHVELQ